MSEAAKQIEREFERVAHNSPAVARAVALINAGTLSESHALKMAVVCLHQALGKRCLQATEFKPVKPSEMRPALEMSPVVVGRSPVAMVVQCPLCGRLFHSLENASLPEHIACSAISGARGACRGGGQPGVRREVGRL